MNNPEIQRIKDQFAGGLWPQFLESVEIGGVRGWSGQSINFRFPVVAIVGENGAGKSTVLKVAASAYDPKQGKGYYPSDFFPSTHWDDVSGVDLGFRIRRGDDTKSFSIRKPSKRWSFPETRYSRDIFWFDVSRTLPLDAAAGYARVAKLAAGETSTQPLSHEFLGYLSNILGRDYLNARFAAPDINQDRPVGLVEREFGEISQFHQGAGEDTTLDLIHAVQNVPDHSLIIVDEVEASLHPKAQRRLVRVLLHLARLKRIQVILSTHSPFVLEELPQEARVMIVPSADGPNIIYGASAEFSLSRIDDAIHPELYIYVEDKTAEILLREILASHEEGEDLLQRIHISPVGPANVVRVMGELSAAGKLAHRSLSILDGDMEDAPGCIKLPGQDAPERVVFGGLRKDQWPDLDARFGVGAGSLFEYLEDAMRHENHHHWPAFVGDRIRKSASSVWEIMATEWARQCLSDQDRDSVVDAVLAKLAE